MVVTLSLSTNLHAVPSIQGNGAQQFFDGSITITLPRVGATVRRVVELVLARLGLSGQTLTNFNRWAQVDFLTFATDDLTRQGVAELLRVGSGPNVSITIRINAKLIQRLEEFGLKFAQSPTGEFTSQGGSQSGNGTASQTGNSQSETSVAALSATVKIAYAAAFITDPALKAKVTDDLKRILNLSNNERLLGQNNLLISTTGDLKAASEVRSSLAYLTENADYNDNPFLLLIKSNAAVTEYRMRSGPGYDINAHVLIAETIRKTNSSFNSNGLTSGEAAFINRQLSILYHQLGDDEKFQEREWIARFYGASNEELGDLNEGDIIEFDVMPSVGQPKPLSKAEQELKQERENMQQQRKIWADTDKIGSQVVPTDHRASELYQKPTDGFETEASREKKIRAGQKGYKGQFKIVTYSERPYQRANVYADGYGGGLDLFIRGEKFLRNGYRLTVIGDYIARRDNLLRKIKNQNQRMVPFKPETIENFIRQLQRDGRITANQLDKINVQLTIRQLEGMWEESNAFWKNRK